MVEEKKKRNSKWVLLVVAAFFGLPLMCALYVKWSEDPAERAVRETRQAAESTAEAGEEEDEDDSPTPTQLASNPTPTFTTRGGLVVAVDEALGESNRGNNRRKMTDINYREDEGSISVTWAADDNFSSGFIVTGIQSDAAAVLRAIDESGVEYERVFLAATFALRDAAGNDSEEEVMLASFDRETIERINWDNFLATDVFELAINYYIAPALSE